MKILPTAVHLPTHLRNGGVIILVKGVIYPGFIQMTLFITRGRDACQLTTPLYTHRKKGNIVCISHNHSSTNAHTSKHDNYIAYID